MSPGRATSALLAIGTATLVAIALTATPATASRHHTTTKSGTTTSKAQLRRVGPTAVTVPHTAAAGFVQHATVSDPCTLPDGTGNSIFHCYTPQDIRAAYGVDGVPNQGAGQTIVLVDSYGSPTAAQDLKTFHDTFFPNAPAPNFDQVFPQGNPQFHNTFHGNGQSGPAAAAGWSGEATLDIEWAYSIAPLAHIVLLAVPPAETLGVQGFPNLFKAISQEIDVTPPGTVFSMSLAVAEPTFGGAAKRQTARFDRVFQKGNNKGDTFFGATGDTGTANVTKRHRDSVPYSHPTAEWPASSPYVTAVGGTQLQYGWTWDPTSNDPGTLDYWNSDEGGNQNTVWNESWGPIGSGGGVSTIYPKPDWQRGPSAEPGNAYPNRTIPDVSWDAAVNGGVEVYISAYPEYNCGNTTGCWTFFGGTSAATPQVAALTALANAARGGKGLPPVGNLNKLIYQLPTDAFTDVGPVVGEGDDAPHVFSGSLVQPDGSIAPTSPTMLSVGDLIDNQMWQDQQVPGYPTTTGYDLTTGLGTPNAPTFVSDLVAMP